MDLEYGEVIYCIYSMPLTPSKGRTTMILFIAFLIVFLSAIYFKAGQSAEPAVTMAGEKSLSNYKSEIAAVAAAKLRQDEALKVEVEAREEATTTETFN